MYCDQHIKVCLEDSPGKVKLKLEFFVLNICNNVVSCWRLGITAHNLKALL